MDKIVLRIPTTQFGYMEVHRDFALEDREKIYQEAIDDIRLIGELWNKPKDSKKPTKLGETMVENGHTYKAAQNEKTGELFWMIDKI